jgi:hypothetical protein
MSPSQAIRAVMLKCGGRPPHFMNIMRERARFDDRRPHAACDIQHVIA